MYVFQQRLPSICSGGAGWGGGGGCYWSESDMYWLKIPTYISEVPHTLPVYKYLLRYFTCQY
jgi:hypothetical protein